MKVIGFGLEKIQAEKNNFSFEKLNINTNIQIKNITEEKIEFLKDLIPLKFSFEFIIMYEPSIANIKIEGYVIVSVTKQQAKDIIKKWDKKNLDEELKIDIFNFIISKTSLKALQIEEDLDLPYHLPFPRIKKSE